MRRLIFFLIFICLASCQKSIVSKQQIAHLNLTKDPIVLDPRKARDLDSIILVRMLFEGLTRTSKSGKIELALASDVEVLNEGLCYVFHLRGSQWSNGEVLTADDFIQSWKMILDPHFATDIAYQLYPIRNAREAKLGQVSLDEVGIYAPDSATLIVELHQPVPYFLELVSMPPFFPVNLKTVKENPRWDLSASSFVCNGPFQLSTWKHSDQLFFLKNPKYWEAEDVRLDGIDFIIASENTALRMFEEKKLDWVGSPFSTIPVDAIEDLKKRGQFQSSSFLGTCFFRMNTEKFLRNKVNPLSDFICRRALACSLDKNSIVHAILQGGQTAARTFVPPEMGLSSDFLPDIKIHTRSLFKENKDPLIISYLNNERNASVVQAIQKQWEEALGVIVYLEAVEPKVFFQKISERDFQIAIGSWMADFNDPINFLEVFKFKNQGTNNTGWENSEYIDLLNRSALCKSPEERMDLLRKAEEILISEAPIIPIFHYALNYLKQKELQGVAFFSTGQIDLRWAYLDNKGEICDF